MDLKHLLDTAKKQLGLSQQAPAPRPLRRPQPWHSVSIQPCAKSCEAARALVGERFLAKQAPMLPLEDCTRTSCTCGYVHFDDRRLPGAPLDDDGEPMLYLHRRNTD